MPQWFMYDQSPFGFITLCSVNFKSATWRFLICNHVQCIASSSTSGHILAPGFYSALCDSKDKCTIFFFYHDAVTWDFVCTCIVTFVKRQWFCSTILQKHLLQHTEKYWFTNVHSMQGGKVTPHHDKTRNTACRATPISNKRNLMQKETDTLQHIVSKHKNSSSIQKTSGGQ